MDAEKLKNEVDRQAAMRAERRNRASTYKERITRRKEQLILRERDAVLPTDDERIRAEFGSYKRKRRKRNG